MSERESYKNLKENAKKMGVNAVISAHFDNVANGKGLVVIAYETVVPVERKISVNSPHIMRGSIF